MFMKRAGAIAESIEPLCRLSPLFKLLGNDLNTPTNDDIGKIVFTLMEATTNLMDLTANLGKITTTELENTQKIQEQIAFNYQQIVNVFKDKLSFVNKFHPKMQIKAQNCIEGIDECCKQYWTRYTQASKPSVPDATVQLEEKGVPSSVDNHGLVQFAETANVTTQESKSELIASKPTVKRGKRDQTFFSFEEIHIVRSAQRIPSAANQMAINEMKDLRLKFGI